MLEPGEKIELEAKFFEQEHRIHKLIANWRKRNEFGSDDPRRKAIQKSIVVRLLFEAFVRIAAPVACVGAVVLPTISTYLLWQQNQLLRA
ncbi:hypothetical protein ACFL2H_13265, partial [Planctomycetota bacterium]